MMPTNLASDRPRCSMQRFNSHDRPPDSDLAARDPFAAIASSDAPVLLCRGGSIVCASPAAAHLFGASNPAELVGHAFDRLANTDPGSAAADDGRGGGDMGIVVPPARRWRTLDGAALDLVAVDVPLERDAGATREPWLVLTLVTNVSEASRTRRALVELEEHLRESQRLAQIGHWTLDLRTGELEWSDEVFRFFELDRRSFTASYEAFLARVHPHDRPIVDAAFRASVEERTPYDVSHRILMPDGRVKHARERGKTFYAADGSPVRSIGTVQDVTGEREREEQLRTAEHALASSCAGIAFADLGGVVGSVNPAFVELWHLDDAEAATGRKLSDFCAEASAAETILDELAYKSASVGTLVGLRDDGSRFFAEYVASVTRDPHGAPLGMLVHFLDVTERMRSERELRESQERLKLVFDNTSDLILLVRLEGDHQVVEVANERMRAALRQAGESPRASTSEARSDDAPAARELPIAADDAIALAMREAIAERRTVRIRAPFASLPRLFDCTCVPVFGVGSEVERVLVTLHDITAEIVAETTLSSTQALLLQAEQLANMGSWQRDLRTDAARWSPGMFRLLGLDPEATTPPSDDELLERIHPDDWHRIDEVAMKLAKSPVGEFACRITLPTGEERSLRGASHAVCDSHGATSGVVGFIQDITAEVEAATRIRAQLEEKEVLLREIHHRVKNNLQIISSLLFLQGDAHADPRIASALEATRGRIAAMALVHEKLYSADDLGSVDMGLYSRDLGLSLFAVFGIDPARVALEVEEPAFHIELDRAIPCGLMVNEMLTNALKHAFPGDRRGRIRIRFACSDDHHAIEVEDDGVGMAWDWGAVAAAGAGAGAGAESVLARGASPGDTGGRVEPVLGLGLKLLPRLAAQLGGRLEHLGGPGTRLRLVFARQR